MSTITPRSALTMLGYSRKSFWMHGLHLAFVRLNPGFLFLNVPRNNVANTSGGGLYTYYYNTLNFGK